MEDDEKKQEVKASTNPLLDEVKAERQALEKARDEARIEANRLEQLRAEALLSGTAGIRPNIEPPKEETAAEYAQRMLKKPFGEKKLESTGF